MGTKGSLLPYKIVGGSTSFIADGVITEVTITHNAGFQPSFFSLTTTEPITLSHLARTITFPTINTMVITFNVAPIVGENANYVWVLFE